MTEGKTPAGDSQTNDSSATDAPPGAVPSDRPTIESAPAVLTEAEAEAIESALKESATSDPAPTEAATPAAEPAPAEAPTPAAEPAPAEASTPAAEAAVSEPATGATPASASAIGSSTTTDAIAPSAPSEAPESSDDAEEVEPESVVEAPKPKRGSHKPPPPPSLRFKSVVMNKEKAGGAAGPRFKVAGTPKLARDLMTRQIFTISPDDTLEHLEEHMHAFRFRHLPVVDGKKLVGLITHRDLLHASSSFLSERAKERDEIIHKVPASRIMQRDLITVRPTKPLAEMALMMWEGKIGCVLVTDEDGTLLGIVTEADFIRLAHHFLSQGDSSPS